MAHPVGVSAGPAEKRLYTDAAGKVSPITAPATAHYSPQRQPQWTSALSRMMTRPNVPLIAPDTVAARHDRRCRRAAATPQITN